MQKLYTFLIFTFCCSQISIAQNQLCDGTRFIDPIFEEVTVTSSVKYGNGVDAVGREFDLLLDVYEPVGDTAEDRPLVVMAHGGSFIFGTRENPYMVQTCTELARRGYVAASISYGLWPLLAGVPDSTEMMETVVLAVGDMKTSIRYFRQDALSMTNEFRIDPDLVMVGGLSAGGVIATQVGMMDVEDDIPVFVQDWLDTYGGIDGQGDHQGYSSVPIGILNFSGGVYRTEWIDQNDVPIFSMHGTADETVPFNHGLAANIMSINGSGSIHPSADAAGLHNEIIIVENGGHTDIYTEPAFIEAQDQLTARVFPFLEDLLCSFVSSSQELVEVRTNVFPNPSSDRIQFQLKVEEQTEYDVLVFDRAGRTLLSLNNRTGSQFELSKEQIGTGYFYALVRFKEQYAPITKAIIFED